MDLSRLLTPRSIAAIGGSWAERVVEQCEKMGFAGEVWPVHPSKTEVRGRRCYRSVAELPAAPDASFVAVNRSLAIDTMRQLADRGAGGAICFASGFKEAGGEGAELERQLIEASGGMPFLGPNCYGLINYVDGALLWPDQHGGERVERGVAILTQSGNIAINMTMSRRAVPIAYVAALGNQAKVDLARLVEALAATGRVSAIGLLIEGIPDVHAFAAAVHAARERSVGIVALKAGHSDAGAALALSHTGSLAGSDVVMDAFLGRLGVARVHGLPELLETLKLLHVHGPLPGRSVVSLSCSGGEALLTADTAHGRGVDFRPFSEADIARIKPTVNPIVALNNPFDYHTFDWAKFDRLERTFTEVLRSGFDLGYLVIDLPREDRCDVADWKLAIDSFIRAGATAKSRVGILATLLECLPEPYAKELVERGVMPFMGLSETVTAIEGAAFIGASPEEEFHPLKAGGAVRDPQSLSEWEAKEALRAFGLETPPGRLVRDAAGARAAFAALGGDAVAVKACSRTMLHKTESGAVQLFLRTADEAADAVQSMAGLAPDFIVEHMVTDAVAELIVGITRDPQLGPVLVVGAGGILVELLHDTRTLLLPTSPAEVERAILDLRSAGLLLGFRGRPRGDIAAAVAAVMAVARYAEANAASIAELDINPLLVRPEGKGAVAVDALVRIGTPAKSA